ncbi:hypothetical protein F5Y03DRAFT_211665 [Xylaria venustula]|nr:hypothetical protein F5Y03DRAFT_211665 [Xylaria venustula]
MADIDSKNSDGYNLGRNYVAASRLNLQHFMYKDAQGYLLHPLIQEYLQQKQEARQSESEGSINVADLATGTGIWLFDLLKSPELSGLDTQYKGFDISRALFPHSSWLPKNVILFTSDLLQDPPQSLHGQFDIVHIRLVLSLVRSGSPKPIIQHIKKLIKPGGYLQWEELDPFNHYDVLTPEQNIEAPNMTATFRKVGSLADWSWISGLPETLLEEGFEAAAQYAHEPATEMFKVWTYMDLCVAEELSLNWNERDDEHGEKWRQLLPKAYAEADETTGAVLRARPTVTVARKPL